ncbi:MAG: STAS domain-containing protein [Burkholderiales bacterium]|jgi:anti-anti-sigma factor|nr:STAS domain-containing protein [Burkholderiales bacterium]
MLDFALPQELTNANVNQLLDQILAKLKTVESLNLDCGQVVNIDSAGIALLLELKSITSKQNIKLDLQNVSASIYALCELYAIKI